MSNFAFLQAEWPDVYEAAVKAEAVAQGDPRAGCFYARRALELAVQWAYKADAALKVPYQDTLSTLIHEPSFKTITGEAVFNKAKFVLKLGNQAVHSAQTVMMGEALTAVRELFHIAYWFARTYALKKKPAAGLLFDPTKVPTAAVPKQTMEQLKKLETALQERDEKLSVLLADRDALDEKVRALQEEVAKAKAENQAQVDTHDYSEAQTRADIIDLMLKEAGWTMKNAEDREYAVTGMPGASGKGYVDYVLWGDDGRPLAVVEAKRTTKSAQDGQHQAKLYADCLEKQFGRRPVMFFTNGYENYFWDDVRYPPRLVQGFYKKDELELLMLRRTARKALAGAEINKAIVGRYYQERAIRRIEEAFERQNERKTLLVMATGAGKTRTVIALCDLLIRCNWAKRILFLADRVALVNQAVGEFKKHLPDASPVNLVTEKETESRVYVSTYPTMMGLIDEMKDGKRRFGVGHFDVIVIDEAHRSVYQKYGAIFRYFDALLVGLTATPKEDIDTNTYGVFDLETGVPTDAYTLEEAVNDGYLVPAKAVSVPLKFQREGIKYAELSPAEQEKWEAAEWSEEGAPDRVEAEAVNKWLFNTDTVDKVLKHLMERGQKVAGGDRLGKTIIFAKNQKHAEFIAKRFDANYPNQKGVFAKLIHSDVALVQSLIDDFSVPEKAPHIAISVDMLDTGIDVPEVVNLVFFKLVRSKTKFWQMVGRGTRLCRNLFGPDQHKEFFYIFDFCQNLEFFNQKMAPVEGATGTSLKTRLFQVRLELIGALDKLGIVAEPDGPNYGEKGMQTNAEVRGAVVKELYTEVISMNLDNFVVRPKRRLVEKYRDEGVWGQLTEEGRRELAAEVAGLPSQLGAEDEEAKRFDLMMLKLQLGRLRTDVGYAKLCKTVQQIVSVLSEKGKIPMVQEQMGLIEEMLTEEWWEGVTVPMLERARQRLRALMKLIEKTERKIVYTSFVDEIGAETVVVLSPFEAAESYRRFRSKVRVYLREHESHVALQRLRRNRPLTKSDLEELERMLAESGVADEENLVRAKKESEGLGLFIRSLVGMDREAAKQAFDGFLVGRKLSANQNHFVGLIIDHLTEHGMMDAALLYEAPFTDIAQQGPESLFSSTQVDELVTILAGVREAAAA